MADRHSMEKNKMFLPLAKLAALLRPRHIGRKNGRANSRLSLERLEDRSVPALFIWSGSAGNGLWSDKVNWGGAVPSNGDDVLIPAGTGAVIFNESVPGLAVSLKSLVCDD